MDQFDVADLPDPMDRIKFCTDVLKALAHQITIMSAVRRQAVLEAIADGLSTYQIAEQAGLTAARISQIVHENER